MKLFIKKIYVGVAILIILCNICACSNTTSVSNNDNDINDKIVITTTIFPIYDFVKNITKDVDNIEINMLLDSGIDLHNFQPSAKDIITIGNSDLFLYIGGESDEWVKSAIDTANNDKLENVNLINELKQNNIMLYDEPDSMKISGVEDAEEEEEDEAFDEHIWLSVNNVKAMVSIISDSIINISNEKNIDIKNTILKNSSEYIEKLDNIDKKFKELFDTDGEKVMVVADRFPFLYFCEDYNIIYYAAFKGCSSQTEASFKTIKYLTDKIDEYNLKYIFKIEKSDTKIADTIIENSKNKDQKILTLNSIQQINKEEIEDGASYISLMEDNYNVLKEFVNK